MPRMVSWYPRPKLTKFTKFGEHMSIGQTLTMLNFIALGQTVYENSVTIFYTLHYFGAPERDPLGQNSPIWVVMYSKVLSINLPNRRFLTTRLQDMCCVDIVTHKKHTNRCISERLMHVVAGLPYPKVH